MTRAREVPDNAIHISVNMLIRFSSGTTISCVLATLWTEYAKRHSAWPGATIDEEWVLI